MLVFVALLIRSIAQPSAPLRLLYRPKQLLQSQRPRDRVPDRTQGHRTSAVLMRTAFFLRSIPRAARLTCEMEVDYRSKEKGLGHSLLSVATSRQGLRRPIFNQLWNLFPARYCAAGSLRNILLSQRRLHLQRDRPQRVPLPTFTTRG